MARYWRDMSWPEFQDLDPETTIAVLPVAAIEQHGPHLPVGVDAFINEAAVTAAMPLMPDSVLILPTTNVGKSNEHLAYPGTLTHSAAVLTAMWTEIGDSVHRAGVRKFVMLNSHGGQPQIMDIVARDLRVRLAMFAVAANLSGLNAAHGLFTPIEDRHGIHGGSSETSQMIHARPDLVRHEHRANFVPTTIHIEQHYRYLRAEGAAVGFGWQTQDIRAEGAVGDATDADAARGAQIIQSKAEGVAALMAEIARFPLAALLPGPLG